MRFFLTQLDGFAASCGGVVLFDDYAEIKRLCHVGQDIDDFGADLAGRPVPLTH